MCEICDEIRREGRHEAYIEGKIEGKIESHKETAYEMYKNKEPIEKIAKYSITDLDTIKKWIRDFSKKEKRKEK